MIKLYDDKNINILKPDLNMALSLSVPTIVNPTKTDVQYQTLTTKYSNAAPISRRFKRELDALYGAVVAKDDLKKVRTGITVELQQAQCRGDHKFQGTDGDAQGEVVKC